MKKNYQKEKDSPTKKLIFFIGVFEARNCLK